MSKRTTFSWRPLCPSCNSPKLRGRILWYTLFTGAVPACLARCNARPRSPAFAPSITSARTFVRRIDLFCCRLVEARKSCYTSLEGPMLTVFRVSSSFNSMWWCQPSRYLWIANGRHSGLDHLASPMSPGPWQEESHRPPLDHEFTNEIWNAPAEGKIVSYSFTRHRRAYSEARRLKPLKEPYNVWMVELSQNVHFILNFFFWNLLSPSGKWCANKKGPHGTSNSDTTPDLASLLGNPLCHLVGAVLCWWTVWIPYNQLPKYANIVNK